MQKFISNTTFEILRAKAGQPVQLVASNCNSILFVALPASTVDGGQFGQETQGPDGSTYRLSYADLLQQAPTVNGIPLLPSVLSAEPLSSVPNANNRQQPGDRLEFNNPPPVIDQTVYEVRLEDVSPLTNARIDLMVVRRFVTPIS